MYTCTLYKITNNKNNKITLKSFEITIDRKGKKCYLKSILNR